MSKVDVSQHPGFWNDFSHEVNRLFWCNVSTMLKCQVDGIDVLDELNVLFKCHSCSAVVNCLFIMFNT